MTAAHVEPDDRLLAAEADGEHGLVGALDPALGHGRRVERRHKLVALPNGARDGEPAARPVNTAAGIAVDDTAAKQHTAGNTAPLAARQAGSAVDNTQQAHKTARQAPRQDARGLR